MYQVIIGGSSWSTGPTLQARTITEARRMAEEYGDTADWASIIDAKGREVALHMRDRSSDGLRWYKASR